MRLAFVPFVALSVSFSLAATPTATIDLSANYFKIDMTRPPPPPAPVYVVNFPDVQAVTGTVNVGNLPAVQTVRGTMEVGNLPLDADGAVRVSNAPSKVPVMYDLAPEPIVLQGYQLVLPDVIDTTGFSAIGVYVSAQGIPWTQVMWRWPGDGPGDFAPVYDFRGGNSNSDCSGGAGTKFVCSTLGGSVTLTLNFSTNRYPPFTVYSVRIYLFP